MGLVQICNRKTKVYCYWYKREEETSTIYIFILLFALRPFHRISNVRQNWKESNFAKAKQTDGNQLAKCFNLFQALDVNEGEGQKKD